jgi:predicted aspartyl protease
MKLPIILVALALAADAAACQFMRVAEWPVRPGRERPVLEGEINGRKIGVLLDTAAPYALIASSATGRLGLTRQPLDVTDRQAEVVVIPELRIGKSVRQNLRARVAADHEFGEEISLVLGEDFAYQADLEFDLRNNAVRAYQAKGCDAGARLAYWSPQALEVPLQRDGDKIAFNIAVNGQVVRAVLDSGAPFSVLGIDQAKARGVHPGSADAAPAGCVRGFFGAKPVDAWAAPFESVAIGDELIRSPRLRFADLWLHTNYTETGGRQKTYFGSPPQMLLGADFLRSHRVLVARSQGKMYFTYEGGTVFPHSAGQQACTR